ncbi:MAG: FtsX-like permease family protein [Alphaproteobacteria bacterium]|nr:FtsX-like permease family protein [Alphaproteobacteria bacterium]
MRALHIKLLRDLRRLWAQALAIALVMAAGVATLILGVGAYDSLSTTRASYYESNRFADIFANVTRAPNTLASDIGAIKGVASVETRILKIALADVEGMVEPASVMLVSLPAYRGQDLNRIHLRSGRIPDAEASTEAVVSEGFAKAHGFQIGSTVRVLINGRMRAVQVVGTALSPEFIYALGPGDLMPDDRRFGVLWMPERALAAAYDLQGAFSSVTIRLLPNASESAVIERLDAILTDYGGLGAYGRKDQTSHAFLDAELLQLRSMSRILPPIFLLVAAFLVNMTLSRLIALEREQIGLLKAMGYSSWTIALHYIQFVSLIALIGIAIGFFAGASLGTGLTRLYAKFFSFPFLVFSRNPSVYIIASAITLGAAVAGAVKAATDVAWLPPAAAMAPPAPPRYSKVLRDVVDLSQWVRQSSVIVMRHLLHWPWRTASGVLGVALAVAVLVGSLWSFGSIDHMIDITFHRSDRQSATISFAEKRPLSALFAASRLPGVLRAEPYRAISVKLKKGHIERRVALTGRPESADLSRVLDDNLVPVVLPDHGIVLSSTLADILGAKRGDLIEVEVLEGDRRLVTEPVSAIITGYIGLTAAMQIDAMNRMLGEGSLISGVHLAFDEQLEGQFFAAIKQTPVTSFVAIQRAALQRFRDTLAQNITIMITVYASLAAIIAFGVIYNLARISLSEQGREMASLRVLGFTRHEVSGLLLGELAVVVLIAQPMGWLIGYGFAWAMVNGFTTELYRVPLIVNRSVYAYASLIVLAAAAVSAFVVRRRIDRLDMIEVLKTRE